MTNDLAPTVPNSPASNLATTLGPGLMLPRLALLQLFALPGDALPQGITRLTGLTQADVQRFAAFDTHAAYDAALRHEPACLYYYALAGWLAHQTVLGEALQAQLHAAEGLPLAKLLTAGVVTLLRKCVPTPTHAVSEALEALFAAEKYGLVPLLEGLPGPRAADDTVAADGATDGAIANDDDIWSVARPRRPELQLFGLALHLTNAASIGVVHPLGAALPGVAALGLPAELLALARRCKAAEAEEDPELPLSGSDVVRIYLSLQVLALLCVADLQPGLMQRLDPELDHAGPWHDPAQQQNFVAYVCTQAEAFGRLFDDLFGEEPTYQAAKATARALAALV